MEELVAMKEDRFIAGGRDMDTTLSSSVCSCILFTIVEQLINLKFLVQQSGAKTADIEQMKKIVPLITCELSFGQNVCELTCGVNVTDLDLGSKSILSNNQSRATLCP